MIFSGVKMQRNPLLCILFDFDPSMTCHRALQTPKNNHSRRISRMDQSEAPAARRTQKSPNQRVRRPRAARACDLCRVKKNKCDELYPCGYCKGRSLIAPLSMCPTRN